MNDNLQARLTRAIRNEHDQLEGLDKDHPTYALQAQYHDGMIDAYTNARKWAREN